MYTTREFEMVVRGEAGMAMRAGVDDRRDAGARSRACARTWQGTMMAIVFYHAHLTLHMHAENCVKV
jgi:hypothetical protein